MRLRPLNVAERKKRLGYAWRIGRQVIADALDNSSYRFDYVCPPKESTGDLYKRVGRRLVVAACRGFNINLFCYGQTASGKTYTTLGNASSPGMVLHAVSDIFHHIRKSPARQFLLRVSCMEIYNEVVNDLIGGAKNLRVEWKESTKQVYIKGLTESFIRSPSDFVQLILKGESRRKTAATHANERSSRSHTIFRIRIESRLRRPDKNGVRKVRSSLLSVVDLAGSECISQLPKGKRKLERELKHINRSLLGLSRVIMSLTREGNRGTDHVPYRDSKVTRILRPALGGNSKTLFICTLSPTQNDREVSRNTLRFGSFAQRVENTVSVNERLDEKELIKKYKGMILGMKKQIIQYASTLQRTKKITKEENSKLRQHNREMQKKLEEHRNRQKELEKRLESLRRVLAEANLMEVANMGANSNSVASSTSVSPKSTSTVRTGGGRFRAASAAADSSSEVESSGNVAVISPPVRVVRLDLDLKAFGKERGARQRRSVAGQRKSPPPGPGEV